MLGIDLRAILCICVGSLPVSGRDSIYGAGNGSIVLDDLECSGGEANLFECDRKTGSHDCTHDEDAAVVCMGMKLARRVIQL